MKRAAIYARISETDELVNKVANQVTQCEALAAREGYAVVATFEDDGISASKFKTRPQWEKLLERITAGEFDVILATEEERFTRQPIEKEALLAVSAEAGVIWHTVRDGRTDPRSAMGEFSAGLRALLGRLEGSRKSERQRDRFEAERAAGRPLWGVRPFGFESTRGEVRESEAALIREAYASILRGGTLWAIVRQFNESGVPTTRGNAWTYQTVRQMLQRERNAGLLVRGRYETVNGKKRRLGNEVIAEGLPAIVSREDFEAVQAILTDPSRDAAPGPKVLKHMATGLATCGVCGAAMTSAQSKGKNGTLLIYKCSKKARGGGLGERHPAIQRDQLEAAMAEATFRALLDAPRGEDEAHELLAPLRARKSALVQKRERAQDLLLEENVDRVRVRRQLAEIADELSRIESEIAKHVRGSAINEVLGHARQLIQLFDDLPSGAQQLTQDQDDEVAARMASLAYLFGDLDIHDQRSLVRSTISVKVNPIGAGERVEITPLV